MKLGAMVQARKPEAGKLIEILGHPESQNNHVGMMIINNGHLGNAGDWSRQTTEKWQGFQGHGILNSFLSVMTTAMAIVRREFWF